MTNQLLSLYYIKEVICMDEAKLIRNFVRDYSIKNYMIIDGIKYYYDEQLSRKKTILCWLSAIFLILPLFLIFFFIPIHFNGSTKSWIVNFFIIFLLVEIFSQLYLFIAYKIVGNEFIKHLIRDPKVN